jgi:diguanylate cyclase (GGDEF)-like protein
MTLSLTTKPARAWARLSSAQRLRCIVWAVGAVGATIIAGAIARVISDPPPVDRYVVILALSTLFTDAMRVNLRVGRNVESYTWSELNIVLGLALLAPVHLVLTSVLIAIAYVVSGRAPVKVIYNATSYAIGTALALLVTHAIATPSWDKPFHSALAIAAGAAAFSWWNGLSINAAIAFAQGLRFREVYGKGARLRVVVCMGNIVIGLVVLALGHDDPIALLAVPPCLALAYFGYRNYLRSIQERAIWRHLEAAGLEIHRLDEHTATEVALSRAASLLEADLVEIALYPSPHSSGRVRVYTRYLDGVIESKELLDIHVEDRFAISTERISGQEPGHTLSYTRAVVPLHGRDSQIGTLRVQFDAIVKLSDRERRLLSTFGYTVATSIENARLYAEMSELAARNEAAALHDPLTWLPNRMLLHDRVRELLEDESDDLSFAVMLVDLDHFKDVNDWLGHAAGDQVLRGVAARLSRAVRGEDTVCRLGGDEFAILVRDGNAAVQVAERLLAVAAKPIEVNDVTVTVGNSIGFACYPEDGRTFDELLHRADVAMYHAKNFRGSCRRYRKDRDPTTGDRLSLVAELRTALDDGQLELRYQPQHDLATNEPVGAEALVRWRHPRRGLLQPHEFIPLVESSSMLREFTCCVLDMALAECAEWQRAGRTLRMAINLSPRSLADEQLIDDVVSALDRHHVSPDLVVLEITETAMLGDLDIVEEQMARLAAIGVALSIDDFGTGSSSLTFLQRVEVHELKIDRSFVAGIAHNENDAAITRATIRLAQSLGLRTVAEGVEDPRVLQELIDLRCDNAQGFLWSPPLEAGAARRVLGIDQPTHSPPQSLVTR